MWNTLSSHFACMKLCKFFKLDKFIPHKFFLPSHSMMKFNSLYIKKNLRTNTIYRLYYPIELTENCMVHPLMLSLEGRQYFTIMLISFKMASQPFGEMFIWLKFQSLYIRLISTRDYFFIISYNLLFLAISWNLE